MAGHEFRVGYRTAADMQTHEGVLMAMIGNLLRERGDQIAALEARLASLRATSDAICDDPSAGDGR